MDTKQRLSKERHHKLATVKKQQQLQNGDSYKTATVTKRRLLQNGNCYNTKRRNTASLKPKWVSVKVPRKGALNIEMGRYGDSKTGFS